jgi:hypothetical protein
MDQEVLEEKNLVVVFLITFAPSKMPGYLVEIQ